MLWLGAGCLTIYIIRLVFRAFFYADMYIAPDDPYGISDVIELLLGAAFLFVIAVAAIIALVLLIRGQHQTRKAAAMLIAFQGFLLLSYSQLHDLAARL